MLKKNISMLKYIYRKYIYNRVLILYNIHTIYYLSILMFCYELDKFSCFYNFEKYYINL